MKNSNIVKKILIIGLAVSTVVWLIILIVFANQVDRLKENINDRDEQIQSLILAEHETSGKVTIVKAWYHGRLENGNVLLETENGDLHEFDNLDANEFDEFRIVFDENGFVGLWEAV